MAFKLANRVKMTVSGTPGTGSITLNAAVAGFVTFAAGGISDGDTVSYVIEDTGNAWELGVGTYTSSGAVLARTTVTASSAGGTTKISATSAAVVFIAPLAADLQANGGYTRTAFTATQGQTSFSVSYTVSAIQVYLNGVLLNTSDYTATSGTSVVLSEGADAGDILEVVALNVTGYVVAPSATYVRTSFTATGGQTAFTVNYTVGYLEVYFNGVLLNASDYTATSGTGITLAVAAVSGDIVETIAYNTVNVGSIAIGTALSGGTSGFALYNNGGAVGNTPQSGLVTIYIANNFGGL